MKPFFSRFFKKREDEEEEEKKKSHRRERRNRLAGALILMILLAGIIAEPVAAFSFPTPQWGWWNELKSNVLGGAVGALAGAKVGASIGAMVGGPVGALVGAGIGALVGYIAGAHIEQSIKDEVGSYIPDLAKTLFGIPDNGGVPSVNFQTTKNVTKEEFENNLPMLNALAQNLTEQADQVAYQDMQILLAKLKSDIIDYDYQEGGDSGEFANVHLKGPESIYGFSAFPIEFQLSPRGNTQVKDPICITNVKIYAKDTTTGDIFWTRTWSYQPGYLCGEEGTVWTFDTILKGYDPNIALVQKVLSGQATEEDIQRLFGSKPNEFEIIVEVQGYREIYYLGAGGEWIFDHTENIDATWSSLSAYRHIGGGTYPLSGFKGTLPIHFKDAPEASEYTRYLVTVAGSSSNLVPVVYANPLHILNATSTYKFIVRGNPGYFNPLNPQIIDDARIVVYRVLKNGNWELAAAVPLEGMTSLGDISQVGKILQASVTYHADSETVAYRVFLGVLADVVRDDNTTIPVWILVEPAIATVDPTRDVVMDEYITEIGDIVGDNVITAAEAEKLTSMAQAMIDSLKTKIHTAEVWKAKGEAENKEDVVNYAQKAIDHYNEAIKYAEKPKDVDDTSTLLRYAEIVKEEEAIGDYYLQAAQEAYYGQTEQAKALESNAKSLEELVDEYKGGLSTFLPDLSDWKSVLWFVLKIVIAIAGIYLAKKLFGTVGALIAAGLAFVFLVGPMFGIYL
ncbi:glycine zipper family protein [Thermococcus sp. CX2]|uniref:glycine zipper domain-containing protein n=1 Tax=Thermococcus sp. CX2 TaxID=163006 RepID=UPI00143AEDA5|nr:YMGG-like glycine zipper-containing protein [Thermococcus sp. CX2]NJE84356.1 glycine zipper family protein [Thermococcus sp. CX2]